MNAKLKFFLYDNAVGIVMVAVIVILIGIAVVCVGKALEIW